MIWTMLLSRPAKVPTLPQPTPLSPKLLHNNLVEILDLVNRYGASSNYPLGTAIALMQRVLYALLALAIVADRGRLPSLAADYAHAARCN